MSKASAKSSAEPSAAAAAETFLKTGTMADFTKIYHRHSYSAISPSALPNSQSGRTVLIAGASTGIGRSISRSFAAAGAARTILVGRTLATLEKAALTIPNAEARVCDISSLESVEGLWNSLKQDGIHVDTLILNAAAASIVGSLKTGWREIWGVFETTVLGNLRMVQGFVDQMGNKQGHALISISSFMAHSNPAPGQGAYSASKAALANLLQHLAEEIPAIDAQIINVHPGAILTDAARSVGMTEDSFPWDDENLPGDFCVWASTKAAAFLHGRFVWANWDVDELMARNTEICSQAGMLKIGLQGAEYVDIRNIFQKVIEKEKSTV
ncbi:short-chain dehydrogenase/reductase [Penicillium alfredii]|uniref:Short-chain dehydrogenase/reductase n=1 Tax=Penicillium alfredii TaxID=1506179 RepID=A0A9W9FRZ9_9EURO|nr:short-chain dehydrogenase/reductase [Penicillium alfredii]KAJ5105267.1 short-chain dehydrogenase/reductase [Penicillium alfredii]